MHVDLKFDEAPFLCEGAIPVKRRVVVNWAGFGIVEASLNWLEQSRRHEDYASHVLLSAQDYPIKPVEEIVRILDAHDRERLQIENPGTDFSWRWRRFHVRDRSGPRAFKDRCLKSLWYNERPVRRLPSGFSPAVGSTYWVFGAQAVDWALERLRSRPDFVDFFRNTYAPDEMFFQTLFANSPFADRLAPNLHWIDWSAGGAHPKLMVGEDFPMLVSSGACFARKFDDRVDASILDRIDRELL